MGVVDFIPQVVKDCKNIDEQLRYFCMESKTNIKDVWFDILAIHTLTKTHLKDEYKLISEEDNALFDDDNFYSNEGIFIRQTYDIKIRPKIQEYGIKIDLSTQADRLYIVFESGFVGSDNEEFFAQIAGEIISLMVQNGVIIRQQNLWQVKLKAEINKSLKQGVYPQKFLLLSTSDFIPNRSAELKFKLKEEWEESEGIKAPENAYFGVGVGEVIAEYFKPVLGRSGRNLRGEYIKVNFSKSEATHFVNYDKSQIEEEEVPEKKLYKSLIIGYVQVLKDNFVFKTDFEFDMMKTIYSPILLGGLQSGISIIIKSSDEMVDAVGSNMIVEASNIEITGSVGENVRLKAQKISIEGQTHQSTVIYAQEANITTHKGLFIGGTIEVKSLDSGNIQADEVKVGLSSGGIIYAKKIIIKRLKSNNKFNFCQECDIEEIRGGNNKIIISASAHTKTKEVMEIIHKKVSLLKSRLKNIAKEYHLISSKIKASLPVIKKIKAASQEVQQAMLSDVDVKRIYQNFMLSVKKLKALKQEFLSFQENIKETAKTLVQIEDETLYAKIITKSEWKFENEVIYHRNYPKVSDDILLLEDGENVEIFIDSSTKKLIKKF